MAPGTAFAQSPGKIEIGYVVEAGGLTMLNIAYDIVLNDKSYRSQARIKSKGLASVFSDYRMKMTAAGAVSGGEVKPAQFLSLAEKKSEERTLDVRWRGDDPPSLTITPEDKEDKELVIGAVNARLVDPLSAMVRIAAFREGPPCQGVEKVFDGRDVYDLTFTLDKKAALGKSAPGSYKGPAYKCSMTYKPLAGRGAVKFKKKKLTPPKFDVWFAPVKSGADGKTLFVPVLASGKLQGFSFTAYAAEATIGGQPMVAAGATE